MPSSPLPQSRLSRRSILRAAATALPLGVWGCRTLPDPTPGLIGVCAGPEQAAVFREAGAQYLEVSCGRELVPGESEDAFEVRRRRMAECGLPIRAANGFLPSKLRCTGSKADHGAVLAYARRAFARAQRIGMQQIVFGSSGARSVPGGFQISAAKLQFASLLGRMGDLAQPFGLVVAVEPLQRKETNFLNTVREGLEIVRAVSHERVRLTADFFHMLREDEGPGVLLEAGAFVGHAHVAEKAERTPPGVAGDDFRGYLQALRQANPLAALSIEARWKQPEEEAGRAVAVLRAQGR